MTNVIVTMHIIVALILIGMVLIQDSKGGGALGMGGGGGSNSIFGATGAQSLAAKVTRIVAIVFALTCLGLSFLSAQQTRSVIDSSVINMTPTEAPKSNVDTLPGPISESPPAVPAEESKKKE